MALVCDTGPLLAALDRGDPEHERCRALLTTGVEDLVVPGLVLSELDYWCDKIGINSAWLTFLDDVDAGVWRLEHPSLADLRRARDLQSAYGDLSLGVVDASIVALCERLREDKLATLDRRHFSVVRPGHVRALTLLPA
ncbi:MAG: PIN domain-containing protein [Candidatus Dormibacteraeota bacterium]|nr:PIN domain-containing protein [Candidatus Dormibacteraeota bacterium]MBV9526116.1 PIN domain-containing protein [Candidatus Dormibacteraeota bacterium]